MPPTIPSPLGELVSRGFTIPAGIIGVPPGGAIGDFLELVDDGFGNPIPQFVAGLHRIAGLVFPFGNGLSAVNVGEFIELPLPFGMAMEYWHIRLDAVGDAAFTVEVASSIAGALASVGGTAPSVSGARGAQDINGLDWTTTTLVRGGVARATLTSATNVKQATLVISGAKTKPGP